MEVTDRWRARWDDDVVEIERGPTPASIPSPGAETTRLGHVSDFHLGAKLASGDVPSVVEHWLADLEAAGVDVAVVTGDLVETPGDRVGLLRIRHLLDAADLDWVVVPGNHDLSTPGCDTTFEELFGGYPRVERLGGAEFLLCDSMGAFPVDDRGPFERLMGQKFCYMRGRVGEAQLDDLEARLTGEPDRPRVLAVHHRLAPADEVFGHPVSTSAPDTAMVPALDAGQVISRFREWGVRAAFHGHRHRHWPAYVRGGAVVFNSGSATRGKPQRRGRIVDLGRGRIEVCEVVQRA
ncbi:MAG: metallophosphoesterase [Bradymonadaceae bacterium]